MRRNIDAMIGKLDLSDEIEDDFQDLVDSIVNDVDVVDDRF